MEASDISKPRGSPVRMRQASTTKTPRNRGDLSGCAGVRAGSLRTRRLNGGESGIRTHGTSWYPGQGCHRSVSLGPSQGLEDAAVRVRLCCGAARKLPSLAEPGDAGWGAPDRTTAIHRLYGRLPLGKCVYREVPWVRIPLSPPFSQRVRRLRGRTGHSLRNLRDSAGSWWSRPGASEPENL